MIPGVAQHTCKSIFQLNGQTGKFANADKTRCIIRWHMLVAILCFAICSLNGGAAFAEESPPRSVVKVFATKKLPDISKPWTKQAPQEVYGSGVIINDKLILTNSHVIAYADQIYVQGYQSTEKISCKVLFQAPGIDLAILKPDDDTLFQQYPALALADNLPDMKQKVNVYGYPIGGKDLSVTEGIVSRIEYTNLFYEASGLMIQIDAALNPGNSGGAAVSDGKMIGIVCSKLVTAENIGYLIPAEEIKIFLNDCADGKYNGQYALYGVALQTSENDALRKRLGIPKETTGIMVNTVKSKDPNFPLKPFDLITHIGNNAIDNEGDVKLNENLRVASGYLIPRLAKDGKVEMTVVREGKAQKMEVSVSIESKKLIRFKGFTYPRYFIYGPMVFTEVPYLDIKQIFSQDKALQFFAATGSPIITRINDDVAFEGEELVGVFSPMFSDKITKGYNSKATGMGIVSHVNDVPVKNLVHLVELLRDNNNQFVTFRFANTQSERLVFDKKEIEAATEEILSENGIRAQYSDDLKEVWEKKASHK
jgi:S1-C subfamily serine protease